MANCHCGGYSQTLLDNVMYSVMDDSLFQLCYKQIVFT